MKENNELHHPFIRKSLLGLKRPEVLYERQEMALRGYLDLSSSINPYGCGPNHYPDLSHTRLKQSYWNFLSPQKDVSNIELLFSRGITEGIDLLIRAFCEPGQDSVFIPTPTFFMYEYWAKAHGIRIEKSDLLGESLNRVDLNALKESPAKIVFLCSPNNPIGNVLPIEHIAEIVRTTKALVVVDEAYIDFASEPSAIRLIFENSNLIILRTFSKAWGLAGMRCGTVIAHPLIIKALGLVQGPFAIPENTQSFVRNYLQGYASIEKNIQEIQSERKRLSSEFSKLKNVKRVFPSEANFLLIEFKNAKSVHEQFLTKEIIIDPSWHHIPDTIRISIGRKTENDTLLSAARSIE